MIYAVVDTNILVSSFISKNPQSPTIKVVEMILDGGITPLYDDDVLAEYNEVLKRRKFHVTFSEVDALIARIKELGIHTARTPFPDFMLDESDRVFFEITLTEEESFLVTGNLKHYPELPRVVTPAEFIDIVERANITQKRQEC